MKNKAKCEPKLRQRTNQLVRNRWHLKEDAEKVIRRQIRSFSGQAKHRGHYVGIDFRFRSGAVRHRQMARE